MPSIPSSYPKRNQAVVVDPALQPELQQAFEQAFEAARRRPHVQQPLTGFRFITVMLVDRDPAPSWLPHAAVIIQDPRRSVEVLHAHARALATRLEQLAPNCARALRGELPTGASWATEIDPGQRHVAVYLVTDLRVGDAA
ncbi:MAG TPA: hypothetical protein PKD61_30110 [Polyangiaceae bacterium]|nr:hypothetical protein [Polyangiaceae bacterium]